MCNSDITWSELRPPPPGVAEYHISISRESRCPVEDYYQLHVYRLLGSEDEDWHLALHLPMLASPGQLAEYRKQFWGPLHEAKEAIAETYRQVARV